MFAELVTAEERHFWFRARRNLILWALQRYLSDTRRFLEVGCGAGFVLKGIRRHHVGVTLAACDLSLAAIGHARQRVTDAYLFQADVRRLPLTGGFDAVAALDVIEHVDEDTDALRELLRVLRPGGGLLLTVPQHQWLWSRVDDFSRHRRRYGREELTGKVRRAGFEVVRCTSFFSATLPFALISRRARIKKRFDPVAELRLSRTMNAALAFLLKPELRLIKAGLSLPVGSSLFLVARRPSS